MKKSDQRELPDATRFLQGAVDDLCVGLTDRPRVIVTDAAIWFSWHAWSPALTRYHYEGAVMRGSAFLALGPGHGLRSWSDLALPLVKANFGRQIDDQRLRSASARALGLIQPDGRQSDLEPDRMVIDRSLLRMLNSDGFDIRHLVAKMRDLDGPDIIVSGLDEIVQDHDERYISVVHDDIGPPVISTREPLGTACYDGSALEIDTTIPHAIAAASVGRPLGALVETGWPEIDARRIIHIDLNEQRLDLPSPTKPLTRITIENDEVSLREACRS